MIKIQNQIAIVCPTVSMADLGVLTPDELGVAQAKWPGALWRTFPNGVTWRIDVADGATSAQREAAQVELDAMDYPEPEAPRVLVRKAIIVDRLHAAGKLEAAFAALNAAKLYTRQRWETRSAIYSDDPTALALLHAIGADPAVIMAAEG